MISTFYKIKAKKRIIVYALVGISAFLAEYFSFILLLGMIPPPYSLVIAQTISFGFGLTVSFAGSRLFTFNDTNTTYAHSIYRQISSYIVLALINLLLSNIAIYVMVHYLLTAPFIAKLLVMSMVVIWNFLIFKKLIFKSK